MGTLVARDAFARYWRIRLQRLEQRDHPCGHCRDRDCGIRARQDGELAEGCRCVVLLRMPDRAASSTELAAPNPPRSTVLAPLAVLVMALVAIPVRVVVAIVTATVERLRDQRGLLGLVTTLGLACLVLGNGAQLVAIWVG